MTMARPHLSRWQCAWISPLLSHEDRGDLPEKCANPHQEVKQTLGTFLPIHPSSYIE